MEPLKAVPTWDSYTPTTAELIQTNRQNSRVAPMVQIVQGDLSEEVDPELGPMVEFQGTFLDTGSGASMTVLPDIEVHFRAIGGAFAMIGRNPQ